MKRLICLMFCACASLFGQSVTVIGIGKVGLCLALSLEDAGYHVLGVDVSSSYVSEINAKTLRSSEPHLNEYLMNSRNFRATTSLKEGLAFSDLCFLLVSTTIGTDSYDYSALVKLLTEINTHAVVGKHLVICSTHAPEFIQNTAIPLLADCVDTTISYNPPFIAQGEIFNGIRIPDMVLIGEGSQEAGELLEGMYKKVCLNSPYIARMSVQSAEITKLGLNCFLTAKIALANLIGDIADETPGADKFAVLNAIGKDQRIGSKYIRPGYGFGGPCFPRDNCGLGNYALSKGIEPIIFRSTDEANCQHAKYLAKQFFEKGLSEYVFENVSYKDNSDIIEASQKLLVAQLVAEQGKKVTILDRENVISQVKNKYGDLFDYEIKH
jgi:UDPglucose 6-dehydrogenase